MRRGQGIGDITIRVYFVYRHDDVVSCVGMDFRGITYGTGFPRIRRWTCQIVALELYRNPLALKRPQNLGVCIGDVQGTDDEDVLESERTLLTACKHREASLAQIILWEEVHSNFDYSQNNKICLFMFLFVSVRLEGRTKKAKWILLWVDQ